jgi:nucleoprotein TPR
MADNAESDAAVIRAQVEREHALADAQKRLKDLEKEVKRVKEEKRGVESERDGAGQSFRLASW